MNKLKAFTIMELIIVMLISIIIISISYKSYEIIERQVLNFIKNNSKIEENILFENTLLSSFENSDIITIDDNNIRCLNDSINIQYGFYDDFVLRENITNSTIDTFKVESKIKKFSILSNSEIKKNIIQTIEISIVNRLDTIGLIYSKTYSIEQLLKIYTL